MFKKLVAMALALGLLAGCSQKTEASQLVEMNNFHFVAQQARAKNIPIMIMFTAYHCEFCSQVDAAVLSPMVRGGMYDGHAMYMRKVSTDHSRDIVFSPEERLSKFDFARMYRADITPTVIFVDWRGLPVAEPLVGSKDVQLYAAMIHQRLNVAYERMGNPMRLPANPEDMRRP
ncbi:thioredoxin fold domain-containing protein [Thiomicrospira sp. ALE5]|uniref:thioredoxin family protein n=1 Tax=Thiomicrospira sp. ALE5 TaxID=748650 RepID=UPI0008F121E2|nr:thioredoxin fold domain-containing protein [Thiomicrospira sp. ALE5]SFR56411.1 Thioredoxin-like [Thiomicrospira sp. ALE5]